MREWRSRGLPAVRVAVNLSAAQFEQENLIDRVVGHLNDNGLPPEALEIEITESVVMNRSHRVLRNLAGFQSTGIPVSIDDFGTGYSSLSYLGKLPVDTLKIDRAFVSPDNAEGRNQVIAESIVALSNLLELGVIAEGIQSLEQLEWLKQLGCKLGQGYLFSAPVPADQATRLLD